MGYALKIYEAFREYGEEKARILAEAFEELEKRYPQILDMATKKDLTETELKLTKEIEEIRLGVEQVRKEMKEVELRLQGEIEQVRKELKETELKLTKEIEQVRREISETKASLVKWMFLFWTGQIIAFAGLLKLMLP
jgi:Rps23 Pro-64 3,4-dihydroxylase Tpa1-like proline 4-hydroxylase